MAENAPLVAWKIPFLRERAERVPRRALLVLMETVNSNIGMKNDRENAKYIPDISDAQFLGILPTFYRYDTLNTPVCVRSNKMILARRQIIATREKRWILIFSTFLYFAIFLTSFHALGVHCLFVCFPRVLSLICASLAEGFSVAWKNTLSHPAFMREQKSRRIMCKLPILYVAKFTRTLEIKRK